MGPCFTAGPNVGERYCCSSDVIVFVSNMNVRQLLGHNSVELQGWDGGKWFTVVPGEPAAEAGLTAVLPQDQALLQHQYSLSSPR